MEATTVNLEAIEAGKKFRCPWNGKVFVLQYLTPSAAWVEVLEEKEFTVRDKKTQLDKTVKTSIKKNEPWSRGTQVEPIND